jgi:hypothetical protein
MKSIWAAILTWAILTWAILTCSMACSAETVTTRDSRSWNGKIVQIQGGVLTLNASFPGGQTATLKFGPKMLRAIELNRTTFNPGAVPNLPAVGGGVLSGTIYLRDRSGHKCANIAMDGQKVTCSAGSWPLQEAMRIIFDPQ